MGKRWCRLSGMGGNNEKVRNLAAEDLVALVKNHKFKEGEPLNIVGHSHGGNIIKEFTQLYEGEKEIDSVVMMGTPQRPDYVFDKTDMAEGGKIINVYDTQDKVQVMGGSEPMGKAGQQMDGALNISIYQTESVIKSIGPYSIQVQEGLGPFDSHTEIDSGKVWGTYVAPELVVP